MKNIVSAQIYLDENVPEYMEGLMRLGSIEFFDEDGEIVHNVTLNNDLVDNSEFHDKIRLIEYVAKRLGIDSSQIEVLG